MKKRRAQEHAVDRLNAIIFQGLPSSLMFVAFELAAAF
jgi:hypothetical protein